MIMIVIIIIIIIIVIIIIIIKERQWLILEGTSDRFKNETN